MKKDFPFPVYAYVKREDILSNISFKLLSQVLFTGKKKQLEVTIYMRSNVNLTIQWLV